MNTNLIIDNIVHFSLAPFQKCHQGNDIAYPLNYQKNISKKITCE